MGKYRLGHTAGLVRLALVLALSSAVYGVTTYQSGRLIDLALAKDMDGLLRAALVIFGAVTAALAIEVLQIYLMSNYRASSMMQAKERYIDDVLRQDILHLQKDKVGQMFSNLTNDFDRYETKYIENLIQLVTMIFQVAASMVLMATVHPLILVVPVLMFIFLWRSSKRTGKPVQAEEDSKSAALKGYTNYVSESIQGFEVIRQHQMEPSRDVRFLAHARAVQEANYRVDVETTKADAINSSLMFGSILIFMIGGVLVGRRVGISMGQIVIVVMAVGQITWPLQRFSLLVTEMRGIEDVLKSFAETFRVEPVVGREVPVAGFEGLEFRGADLGYGASSGGSGAVKGAEEASTEEPSEQQVILSSVDLALAKGEKILIVGPSGAGKSTILKTLRLTTPALAGAVFLNGIDIETVVPETYFSLFTTVDQIGFIFSGSLRDNLTLYQEVPEARLRAVLGEVGLAELDPDMVVRNDGSNLSGGQRARVLLARALCLDASVIICDEIFASLDAEVARSIERDMLGLEKSAINVSHIYFSENLPLYDRIYIVENGRVRVAGSVAEVEERMLEAGKVE